MKAKGREGNGACTVQRRGRCRWKQMKSLSPSCFKCQIMLDISISPRRAAVKSSWTLLKVLKLPSALPVESNRSDSVLSWVWNGIIIVTPHNRNSEKAPNVFSVFMDGLLNRLCPRAQCSCCAEHFVTQVEMMGLGTRTRLVCNSLEDSGLLSLVHHVYVAFFTWGSPVLFLARSWVLQRPAGEISKHWSSHRLSAFQRFWEALKAWIFEVFWPRPHWEILRAEELWKHCSSWSALLARFVSLQLVFLESSAKLWVAQISLSSITACRLLGEMLSLLCCWYQTVKSNPPPPPWVGIMVTQLFERPHWIGCFEKYTLGLWLLSTWEGLWLMIRSLRAWLRAARIYIYHLSLSQCLPSCGLETTSAAHNVTVRGEGVGGWSALAGSMVLAFSFVCSWWIVR